MFLRGIGATLIAASGAWYGLVLKNNYRKRIQYLERLMIHLEEMKGNIVYRNEEMREILSGFSSEICFGTFFTEIVKRMEEGQALKDAWKNSMNDVLKQSVLRESELKIIEELGEQLGENHRETQARQIEFIQKKLSGHHQVMKKEEKEKCKLYTSLGILGGIMVSIMLI